MRDANSKEYRDAVKKYIFYWEATYDLTSVEDAFLNDCPWEIGRFGVNKALSDWLHGGVTPSIYNNDIRRTVARWRGIKPEELTIDGQELLDEFCGGLAREIRDRLRKKK